MLSNTHTHTHLSLPTSIMSPFTVYPRKSWKVSTGEPKMGQKLVHTSNLQFPIMKASNSNPSFPLLGPPEIYLTPVSVVEEKTSSMASKGKPFMGENKDTPVSTGDPFMDANFNDSTRPRMGYTENNSPTFYSTGNHCLDFFFHVVPDTPASCLMPRLQLAWEQDPLMALKLVCNLRGVRGSGKMDREGFYASALWLHENHPKTLASNAASIAKFGYFKDLPEILDLLLKGPDAKELEKKRRQAYQNRDYYQNPVKMSQKEKRISEGKKGVERYNNDPVFRALHDQISTVFAEQLKSDIKNLNSGKLRKISLAAKWCPSLYSSYDRSTLLCESIARRIFTRDQYPEYEGVEDAHYAYRIRYRLQKNILVPLRKALKVPEIYMSSNQWDSLLYSRVPSLAMKIYTNCFLKQDEIRFKEYLDEVKKGKAKISAGALLPHQIISSVRESPCGEDEVAELQWQWQRMVEDLSSQGSLKNCLAICDVSGSMTGLPLNVSVALGMLVSELSEFPWKGSLITCSRSPKLQNIQGDDLRSKIRWIESMEWQMNTDFKKVFDVILRVAEDNKLSDDQMIKRLFVFSDMDFDEAIENNWETDYEAITRKFKEKGFSSVPEIVFWNLRHSMATPVPSNQKGVALVSGFSKNLLKMFLKESGELDPLSCMIQAISGKEYNQLVVVD